MKYYSNDWSWTTATDWTHWGLNTLSMKLNGHHFANSIFKYIFLYEWKCLIQISLKLVPIWKWVTIGSRNDLSPPGMTTLTSWQHGFQYYWSPEVEAQMKNVKFTHREDKRCLPYSINSMDKDGMAMPISKQDTNLVLVEYTWLMPKKGWPRYHHMMTLVPEAGISGMDK